MAKKMSDAYKAAIMQLQMPADIPTGRPLLNRAPDQVIYPGQGGFDPSGYQQAPDIQYLLQQLQQQRLTQPRPFVQQPTFQDRNGMWM